MIIKEYINKIYLFLYLKFMGTEKELKKINEDYHKNQKQDAFAIDDLDRLSTGSYVGEDGQAHIYSKTMPERFWKYFKYKGKVFDDEIFRKKNLLFIGKISDEERKKTITEIAKSTQYRNKKGK